MSKLKLKINVKVPQLLCIDVSVALNGEFERFGGFCVDCYTVNLFSHTFLYISNTKQTHCLYGWWVCMGGEICIFTLFKVSSRFLNDFNASFSISKLRRI